MRRLLSGFLAIAFVFLTACSSGAGVGNTAPVLNFNCKADVTLGKEKMTAALECSSPGMFAFTTSSLRCIWNGEGFVAAGGDLERMYSVCPLPKDSAPVLVHGILSYSAQEGALSYSGGATWKGSLDGLEYSLTVDSRGRPQNLSAPRKGLEVEFHDYTEM